MTQRWPDHLPDGDDLLRDPPAGHMRFLFSPEGREDPRRLAAFLESTGVSLRRGNPQLMRLKVLRFSEFLIAHVQADPLELVWGRASTAGRSRYVFLFVNRGAAFVESSSPVWSHATGGLCVVFPGRSPVTVRVEEPSELIVFSFDRREIDPFVLTAQRIDESTPDAGAFRAIYAYLQAATELPRAGEGEKGGRVLRALTRDVARAVTIATIREEPSEALFQLAQQEIRRNYAHQDFGINELARLCGASSRTLHRIYTSRGTHIAKELLHERTQNAMILLSENPALTVEAVATACGFGSASTMARAFKRTYGVSPAAARAGRRGSVS